LNRIETQEYILGDLEAERIVEVGPSNTLTNMMKRTWEAHHSQSDTARNVNRRILGPKGDMAEIYYQAEPETQVEETPTVATSANVARTTPQDPPSANEAAAVSQTPQSTAPREQLQDIGLSAASVILAIIGTKLKKQPTEISLENTISNLVSGK
jgi:fatty acid synthase subunit alpha, fungi type